MNPKPKFVIMNASLAGLTYAAWHLGFFAGFPSLGLTETAMIWCLVAYALFGAAMAFRGRWDACAHVANSLPMIALGFTGLGLILAAAQIHDLTPTALAVVFQSLAFSIAPNVVGVALMVWLRTLAWYCVRIEV